MKHSTSTVPIHQWCVTNHSLNANSAVFSCGGSACVCVCMRVWMPPRLNSSYASNVSHPVSPFIMFKQSANELLMWKTVCCCLTIARQLFGRVGSAEIMRTMHNLATGARHPRLAWQHEKVADLRGIVCDLANLHLFPPVLFWFYFLRLLFYFVLVCDTLYFCRLGVAVVWLWCFPSVWLCSIDPCIAVLCHGWHRGVALCRCGETSLPWFFYLSASLSLFLSFHFLFP